VTRVASVMLTLTGLSAQSARFQARSAFSGAGFTTNESEAVVNHPVRRRIIMSLMLLGNAGIVSGIAAFLLSFANTGSLGELTLQVALIIAFLAVLIRLAQSHAFDRVLTRVIERALRRFTALEVRDYAGLLRLSDEWIIGELLVESGDWLCDQSIDDLQLTSEGVLALGIERADGRYVGAPKATARFHDGDIAVLYGLRATIDRIDERSRDAEGEMDWVRSQIDYTERYLEQQEEEHEFEDHVEEADEGEPNE
jgi:K+/H+ antiporter YhaU regulatory subunit KhtT